MEKSKGQESGENFKRKRGQMQCLKPVILVLWETKAGGSVEPRVQDQHGQHSNTLPLQKN